MGKDLDHASPGPAKMLLPLMNKKLHLVPHPTYKSKLGWIALRWWNFSVDITVTFCIKGPEIENWAVSKIHLHAY